MPRIAVRDRPAPQLSRCRRRRTGLTRRWPLVQPTPPAILELAQRLRNLRQGQWPDFRLTQAALATDLGGERSMAAATVSSWESPTAPKLPPRDRMLAYARFFATRRSVEGPEPRLLPAESLDDEEQATYQQLAAELLGLRDAARSRLLPRQRASGDRGISRTAVQLLLSALSSRSRKPAHWLIQQTRTTPSCCRSLTWMP